MGEYALYQGYRIKIGTCEDMYYLRADQAHLVTPVSGSLDPVKEAEQIRFRFPFPDEDRIEPGRFGNYARALGLHDVDYGPAEHRRVQWTSNGTGAAGRGALTMTPCPLSSDWPEGLKAMYNGFSGNVQIRQQRLIEGALWLVCECGICGAAYRVPPGDLDPIIDKLAAEARLHDAHDDPTRADYYREISLRILAGYTGPLPQGLERYAVVAS